MSYRVNIFIEVRKRLSYTFCKYLHPFIVLVDITVIMFLQLLSFKKMEIIININLIAREYIENMFLW